MTEEKNTHTIHWELDLTNVTEEELGKIKDRLVSELMQAAAQGRPAAGGSCGHTSHSNCTGEIKW